MLVGILWRKAEGRRQYQNIFQPSAVRLNWAEGGRQKAISEYPSAVSLNMAEGGGQKAEGNIRIPFSHQPSAVSLNMAEDRRQKVICFSDCSGGCFVASLLAMTLEFTYFG